MKKIMLQFLVVTLFSQSYIYHAQAQVQSLKAQDNRIDTSALQIETSEDVIDETVYPKATDVIREAKKAGQTVEQFLQDRYDETDAELILESIITKKTVDEILEERFGQYAKKEKTKKDIQKAKDDEAIKNGTYIPQLVTEGLKHIATPQGIVTMEEKIRKPLDNGKWALRIVYFPKVAGGGFAKDAILLTSYRANDPIKPASTMKIFTGYMAYKAKSYDLATLKHMLKHSNNYQANMALDSVGRKAGCEKSQLRACSINIVKKEIAGLPDSNKFNMVNGSGLNTTGKDTGSELNMVTAQLETAYLAKALSEGHYDGFKKTLAIPGQSGTLGSRLGKTNVMAPTFAKTGTLDQTISLAGYAEGKKGVMVFSILSDELPLRIIQKKIKTKSGKVVTESFSSAYRRAVKSTQGAARNAVDNVLYSHAEYLKNKGL
jgi:D-Ala-D-Ala carboxypeptidase 3 (S13) family